MQLTRILALRHGGVDATPVEMPEETRTADQAAAAAGCDLNQIVKSILFQGASGRLYLFLTAGGNQVDAARARYDEAVAVYQGRVRQAVSEVEQALVRLQSTAERADSARAAVQGYRTSFDATEARWRGGLASLVELEDARRTALAAENALVALQHERMAAWVALYRAAGGGWNG